MTFNNRKLNSARLYCQ